MLEKLWDDVVAGPQPERGLGRLRKLTTHIKGYTVEKAGANTTVEETLTTPCFLCK
ncbi:hypothetical protein TanjilG_08040 [Lupinus angustifolius]|uniref:Uncharacterized protein n=1 Tax=Lupinus angustifolius TaxID=3871 RepID=A0A4P1RMI9_LUPAN|nr:hypothetical protein TanjilG_08040 [Lupinus angustifolius]